MVNVVMAHLITLRILVINSYTSQKGVKDD